MATTTKKAMGKSLKRVTLYHNVFNSKDGAQVLHDLMAVHGMLSPQFPASGDANELIYREGARSVVLRILTLMKTDPQQLLERIKEYESENAE